MRFSTTLPMNCGAPHKRAGQERRSKAHTSFRANNGKTKRRVPECCGTLRVRMWDSVIKFDYACRFAGNPPDGTPAPPPSARRLAWGAGWAASPQPACFCLPGASDIGSHFSNGGFLPQVCLCRWAAAARWATEHRRKRESGLGQRLQAGDVGLRALARQGRALHDVIDGFGDVGRVVAHPLYILRAE